MQKTIWVGVEISDFLIRYK